MCDFAVSTRRKHGVDTPLITPISSAASGPRRDVPVGALESPARWCPARLTVLTQLGPQQE